MTSKELALVMARLADEKRARHITLLDMAKVTTVTDYFLICGASSTTQARAIADHILEGLREEGVRPDHVEGYTSARWVLLDFGGVVVHVFVDEERRFYDLERLWGDAAPVPTATVNA